MEESVRVNVITANVGQEAAKNIQVHAIFQDTVRSSKVLPSLKPGQTYKSFIDIHPKLALPGSYPVEVRVDFHDLNDYLFTSLAHASFIYKEAVNIQVFVRPTEAELTGKAKLNLEVLNMDQADREVRIRLLVPRELQVKPAEQTLRLKGGGKQKVTFKLKNFSAIEGSAYPVFSFLEYEADGRHYSNVAESRVQVTAGQNFFEKHTSALIIVIAALGLVVVLFQVFRTVKKA